MGATLSLCWFTPGWMYFGHVGDSRIYHLPREGGLAQLTHDHTHVGWLRRQGEINEREARTHPRRNALQQALGAGNQFVEPQIGAVARQPGDRFLICSDGLVDGLWDRRIEASSCARIPRPRGPWRGPGARRGGGPELGPRQHDRRPGRGAGLGGPFRARRGPAMSLVFVYGTLKRGYSNHHFLAGQAFQGEARTAPGFALFSLGFLAGANFDGARQIVGSDALTDLTKQPLGIAMLRCKKYQSLDCDSDTDDGNKQQQPHIPAALHHETPESSEHCVRPSRYGLRFR